MSKQRKRYVTQNHTDMPRENLTAILADAARLAKESASDGLLITFTAKGNLEAVGPLLAPVISQRGVEILKKKPRIATDPPIQVVTDLTLKNIYNWNGPVLMIYPTQKMIYAINAMTGVTCEIVVPWIKTDAIDAWISARSPTPIMGASEAPSLPEPDAAVVSGLSQLTLFVNQNNGLVTKTDREEAIKTFETIIRYSPGFTAADLHAYLLGALGWEDATAGEARSIYENLIAGKNLRGRSGPDANLWAYWSQESS